MHLQLGRESDDDDDDDDDKSMLAASGNANDRAKKVFHLSFGDGRRRGGVCVWVGVGVGVGVGCVLRNTVVQL